MMAIASAAAKCLSPAPLTPPSLMHTAQTHPSYHSTSPTMTMTSLSTCAPAATVTFLYDTAPASPSPPTRSTFPASDHASPTLPTQPLNSTQKAPTPMKTTTTTTATVTHSPTTTTSTISTMPARTVTFCLLMYHLSHRSRHLIILMSYLCN